MAYQSAGMFSEAVGRMSDMMGFHLPAQESGAELFSKQFLNASAAAGLGKHLDLRGEWQLGGVAWIRHAAMTALRPKVGVDVVSKYANHSSVAVTEFIYDLDRHARDLKALAVEPPRTIFHLGGAAIAKRGKRKKK